MVLGIFKISGHSMIPYLFPGDKVIVSALPYTLLKPKINDVVLFYLKNKVLVKRIKEINGNRILTNGDNSSDSLKTGWVERKDIIGKVLFKI